MEILVEMEHANTELFLARASAKRELGASEAVGGNCLDDCRDRKQNLPTDSDPRMCAITYRRCTPYESCRVLVQEFPQFLQRQATYLLSCNYQVLGIKIRLQTCKIRLQLRVRTTLGPARAFHTKSQMMDKVKS